MRTGAAAAAIDAAAVGCYPIFEGFTGGYVDRRGSGENAAGERLDERQALVLRAVITAYVGEAAPIGSKTLSHLLPVNLSPASIRNTLSELTALGLVEKPHASSGRVPTERGLRLFVDELRGPGRLAAYERRTITYSVDEAEVGSVASVASQLLSERTRQLGFMLTPRVEQVPLRHIGLVRLSMQRVLVILIAQTGQVHRRVIEDREAGDQTPLDRVAALLNERIAGRTLRQARRSLAREAGTLRHRADHLLARALELGARAVAAGDDGPVDLVVGTRLALLDQPEFRDPERIRELFAAIETKERLIEILDRMLEEGGTRVAFGDEVGEPALHRFALVAAHYGDGEAPLGALGVIGPSRMDYARVIPFVGFLSQVITEKFSA